YELIFPGFSGKEQRYMLATLEITDTVGNALERLSDLTSDVTVLDFVDDDWILDVATQLAIIKVSSEEIQKLTPPPAFESIHGLLVQALELYAQSADNLALGIDNLDAGLINQAVSEMDQGRALVEQATTEMGRLREERQVS
ncbi:MAG: hypothetical protein QOF01_1915, partial [Thermomicrobiales bacterium]|nr:hypothetical protein [Thermomicrobiales bacterium]